MFKITRAVFSLAVFLVSASGALAQDRPVTAQSLVSKLPNVGLTPDSYGKLDPYWKLVEYCDGTKAASAESMAGVNNFLSSIGRVIGRALPPSDRDLLEDQGIKSADLQSHFKALYTTHTIQGPNETSDVEYLPTVSMIERKPDRFAFWWYASPGVTKQSQIEAAADEYCRRQNKGVTYRGSAAICGAKTIVTTQGKPTDKMVREKGQAAAMAAVRATFNYTPTYVISGYACEGEPTPEPPSAEKKR